MIGEDNDLAIDQVRSKFFQGNDNLKVLNVHIILGPLCHVF